MVAGAAVVVAVAVVVVAEAVAVVVVAEAAVVPVALLAPFPLPHALNAATAVAATSVPVMMIFFMADVPSRVPRLDCFPPGVSIGFIVQGRCKDVR
jgi:hypothetical protein